MKSSPATTSSSIARHGNLGLMTRGKTGAFADEIPRAPRVALTFDDERAARADLPSGRTDEVSPTPQAVEEEEAVGMRREPPPPLFRDFIFSCSLSSLFLCSLSSRFLSFFFPGTLWEWERGLAHSDRRAPHGFAEEFESWTGTGLGHIFREPSSCHDPLGSNVAGQI